MSIDYIVVLVNFIAFLVSLFSLYIVADSASAILVPSIRRGLAGLLWGLGSMALAFLAKLVGGVLRVTYLDLASSGLLLLGIILLFLGVAKLFRLHKAQQQTT